MQTRTSKKKWAAGAAMLCAAIMMAARISTTKGDDASDEAAALAKFQEQSGATKALAKKVMRGLVRVRLEQSPELLLSKELKSAWEESLRSPRDPRGNGARVFEIQPTRPGGGPGNRQWPGAGGGPGRGGPGRGEDERRPATAPASQPAPVKITAQLLQELERFIASRVFDQDPAKASEAKITLTKIRALRQTVNGEMYANLYDDGGHAILMAAVVMAPNKTLHGFLSDGTEVTAKVAGTNFIRGLTVLQCEDKTGSPLKGAFNACAASKPESGEMVMNLSPNSGAIAFGYMPVTGFGRKAEPRFNFGGSGFLFTSRGELSAFVSEGSAIPFSTIADEMKAMADGRSIQPKTLGILYGPLGEISEGTRKLIAGKPAFRITGIIESSPAKGDIQKNDIIIAVDGQPVTQLERVLEEWQLKNNDLKIELIRGEELLTKIIKSDKQ